LITNFFCADNATGTSKKSTKNLFIAGVIEHVAFVI
jgi:hypothetical protein